MSFFRGYLEIFSIGWVPQFRRCTKCFLAETQHIPLMAGMSIRTVHLYFDCKWINTALRHECFTSYQAHGRTGLWIRSLYRRRLLKKAKFNSFPLKSTYNFHSGRVGTQSLHVSHSCLWFLPDWTAFYVDIFPCQKSTLWANQHANPDMESRQFKVRKMICYMLIASLPNCGAFHQFNRFLVNADISYPRKLQHTPISHTPGNPPTQLWKDSLYNLLVKV